MKLSGLTGLTGLWGVLAAISLAASALAQTPSVITRPDWARQPRAEDMEKAYPQRALTEGVDGKATLRCIVTASGSLTNCKVLSETREGYGFGAAALSLTSQMQMRPRTMDGEAVGGFPVVFSMPFNCDGCQAHLTPLTPTMSAKGGLITRMVWLEAPTSAEVAAAYPARAKVEGKDGSALIRCRLSEDGKLQKCNAMAPSPDPYRFGAAALKLADRFTGPKTIGTGQSIKGAEVILTIAFPTADTESAQPLEKVSFYRRPSREDYARLAPNAVSGVAQLVCKVGTAGVLEDCAVNGPLVSQAVRDAALSLVSAYRVSAWTDDGVPTSGALISFPVTLAAPVARKPG